MKKIMLIASLLSCYNLIAQTDASIKTGIELNPEFAPRLENQEKNIYASDFTFDKLGYNLKLLDLNINMKDYGLTLGTTVKSQRNNIMLNDWRYN